MKRSQLRQIIREEILVEFYGETYKAKKALVNFVKKIFR